MLRTPCARLACVATVAALLFLPRTLLSQQALVYCPIGIDATGCNAVVAAITADAARFPGGADAAYDGTGGTVDLATADLTAYAVFVVPSLADGPDAQPYSLIRNGTIAGRLRAAFVGRTAVWSGTPDIGIANRGAKDALIQNLAAWAKAEASGARGPGLVVLQDNSDDEAARYGWLAGVSGVSAAADPTLEIYSNAEVLTATGQTILTNGSGLQIGYTNMASAGLVSLSGLTADATGGRSGRPVLATAAGEGGGDGIATVHTDKEDYSPGETVIITGSGWEPGETVSMVLHEDPTLHENRTFNAVADPSGNIYNNSFVVDEHDLGVRFTLVATGQTSGRSAQTTFTDGTVKTRSNLAGITYTLTWTAFTTTTCGGTADGPHTEPNVGFSGGAIFNKGIGSTDGIRLTAPALSDQGGSFTGWSSDTPGSFTILDPPTNRVICVSGNFSGNREYIASYTTPVVNLSIDKSHSGTFIRGTSQDYILAATNSGTAPTNAIVTIRDTLPAGLTFVSGTGTDWTCTAAGQVVTCTRPAANVISAGQTAPTITLKVSVGAATAPSITNRARVSGGGEAATSTVTCDAANNCDADPTTVVNANAAPQVDAGGPYTGAEGSAIALNTATATDVDGDALTYKWTYVVVGTVDLGTSCSFSNDAVLQPTFTCNDDGAFTVTLTVNDGNGHTVADNASVTVTNVKPTATAGGPYGGSEGVAVQLAGAGDDSANNDDDPKLTYLWTVNTTGIDAGGTCTFDDATKKNAKVTCTDNSNATPFTLTLVATDDDGASSTGSTATLTVANADPVADAGGPYSGDEGAAISLNGTVTDAGTNDTHTWSWVYVAGPGVDAGATCSFSSATAEDPTITCTDDGTVELTFTATDDNGGTGTDHATLTVKNVAPVAHAGGPYSGSEGVAIQLAGSATDAGGNDTQTYKWTVDVTGIDAGGSCTFDDSTKKDAKVTCTDNSNAQPFKLKLVATDDDGAASTASEATLTVANADPVADAGGPYTGNEGSAISLNGSVTDAGSNDTHVWSWAYVAGAGVDAGATCTFNNAAAEDPTITCTDDGEVQLTLTVKDDNGGQSADQAILTVKNVAPVAKVGGPYSGDEGLATQLAGSATDIGANDVVTYKWTADVTGIDAGGACTFDDDTKKDAQVTCTDDGAFKVTLTATDDDGGSSSEQTTLTVANADPVADAGGPYDGDEGAAISLNGTVTDAGSNDTHTWSWVYVAGPGVDAGATCQFNDATAEDPTIKCTDDGTVKLTLTVTDDNGGTGTDEATLTLANVAPVAKAGGPYSGDEGSAIPLAGSATDAGTNDVITYKWTADASGIPNGGTCTFDDATKKDAKITCNDNGTVTLTLEAKDDDGGTDTDVATLTVANVDPVAHAGGPYTGDEGSNIQLNGSVTDAGANDTHTWSWHYVAGPGVDAGATCTFSSATAEDPTVKCTDDGTVELTLTVKDDDGGEGSDHATLTVKNVAPVAAAGGPYAGNEGDVVQLAGSATDAGSNDVIGYKWTADVSAVPNGGTCSFDDDTKKDAKVTCNDNGTVKLTLTATDDDGGSDTDLAELTLANVDPVAKAGGPYTGNEGAAVQLNGSVTDAGGNDTHTWSWEYVAGPGVDAGATCTFSSAAAEDPTITCTDDGTVELTFTATDDDGGKGSDKATLTLHNVNPVADAGGPYNGNEGAAVSLNGTVTDAGSNDSHTWSWEYVAGPGVDAGATCSFSSAAAEDPTITCTDDGTVELTFTAADDDGGTGADHATLTLKNVAPVAKAGGPYSGTEGVATQLNGSATDVGANDLLAYKWTVDFTGIDAGGGCTFDNDTKKDAKVTCTDDGTFKLTLAVNDDDGGTSSEQTTLTVANANPVATAGGPYSGSEGSPVSLSGAVSDPGSNDPVTHAWTYTPGVGVSPTATCSFSPNAAALNASITCNDNGSFQVTLTATDDDGGTGTSSATVTLINVNPVLGAITAPVDPVDVAILVTVSAPFTDQGKNDTHPGPGGTINWGDGTTSIPTATETPGSGTGTATGSHKYTGPGVYTITMTVADDDGGVSNVSTFQYVVIFDPSAGFVTGGGYIMSPVGAYVPDPTLVGKANFGFVAKYQKGKTIPDGDTEFQFHAASVNFKSTSYQWLVVQGTTKASYKGEGTINGAGAYGFMLSVVDGGSTADKFRIKIWNKATSVVVYDNQMGGADDATASQGIASGSIVIHTNGGIASK